MGNDSGAAAPAKCLPYRFPRTPLEKPLRSFIWGPLKNQGLHHFNITPRPHPLPPPPRLTQQRFASHDRPLPQELEFNMDIFICFWQVHFKVFQVLRCLIASPFLDSSFRVIPLPPLKEFVHQDPETPRSPRTPKRKTQNAKPQSGDKPPNCKPQNLKMQKAPNPKRPKPSNPRSSTEPSVRSSQPWSSSKYCCFAYTLKTPEFHQIGGTH